MENISKNTKLIRISAYTEGEYSKAVVYGERFLSYDNDMLDKVESFNDTEIWIWDLNRKRSDVDTKLKIKVEVLTLQELAEVGQVNKDNRNVEKYITDFLLGDLEDVEKKKINEFTSKINEILEQTRINVVLTNDTEIGEYVIPKGTEVSFTIPLDDALSK